MLPNETPAIDLDDRPTGCCPAFRPADWDGQEFDFNDKPFVKASTRSLFHVPVNMGPVFAKTWAGIERAHAAEHTYFVLSHDDSPWHADHFFAVEKDVPGAEMVHLSGHYLARVFEGPYSEMRDWAKEMERVAGKKGKTVDQLYYFDTTCPKCAKAQGRNYVVGVAQVH